MMDDQLYDEMGRPAPPYPDEGMMALEGTLYPPEPEPRVWLKASEVEPFLRQTKVWRNKENKEIPIADLDGQYALNILWFLDKKAEELWYLADEYRAWVSAAQEDGPVEGMPRGYSPIEWMRRTELYRAIAQHAYRFRTPVVTTCEHGWTGDDFCPKCSDETLSDIEERDHQFGHD